MAECISGLLPIPDGAKPRELELHAPSGTYRFFDGFCGPAGPPNQRRSELCSFERNGNHIDLYRSLDLEGKPTGIHVTVGERLHQEFCDAIYTMDITPDGVVERLRANLNMMGASMGLPEPQPDLDKALQIARFVLGDPSILMG